VSSRQQDSAGQMAAAHQNCQPKPTLEGEFSLPEAYEIQAQMIELLDSTIIGYKSALSSSPAQAAFDVSEPLLGALLENSAVDKNFRLEQMGMPMIEVEMGYELSADVTEPITIEGFSKAFSRARIAIDLPEVGYAGKPSAVDLVAGNSAAGRFLAGAIIGLDDPNAVQVQLLKDGELINEARSGDIGDQRALAVWLVNKALSLGYPVKAEMLMMTGALGQILPAQPGQYEARYQADAGLLCELIFNLA